MLLKQAGAHLEIVRAIHILTQRMTFKESSMEEVADRLEAWSLDDCTDIATQGDESGNTSRSHAARGVGGGDQQTPVNKTAVETKRKCLLLSRYAAGGNGSS